MNVSVPTALATQAAPENYSISLTSNTGFELIQRAARLLASSTLVPKEYQGNIPNCVIALNMSQRLGADALMVMQNLVVIHGRPTWSAQFLIATVNACGRFTAMRYEFFGEPNEDTWGCRAHATERATGEKLVGTDVTIAIAKKEGWFGKNGSKWQSIPQQMLMYRAGSWWTRAYAPELSMGLHTADEIADIVDVDDNGTVSSISSGPVPSSKPRVVMPQAMPQAVPAAETIDADTGEITQPTPTQTSKPPAQPRESIPGEASEGEKKLILTRARNNNIDMADLMQQAGLGGLPADLAGLSKDGFIALRDCLPKAA